MENELTLKKHSSLEKSIEVVDALEWKMKVLEEQGRPIEESLSDYIGFSLDNLNRSIDAKKFYIDELKALIKKDEEQINLIKTDGVKFLDNLGVDRLNGHIVSSVTISKERPAQTKEKQVLKYLLPKDEIEQFLIDTGKAEMETIITETKDIPRKIRVTQRRVKNIEIVEEMEK